MNDAQMLYEMQKACAEAKKCQRRHYYIAVDNDWWREFNKPTLWQRIKAFINGR